MKAKEVPQDDENLLEGKFKDPIYTLDEDGNYTTSYSVGWDVKNAVLKNAWGVINEKMEQARQDVMAGKASPIKYYMEKTIMDPSLLAKYTGYWKWTVKKHLKPKGFNKLNEEALKKYADIFDLTVEELKDIDKIKNDKTEE
ncbi:MAG: hypothetical protein DRJ09_05630 [Bacteroidetes bacterium]|nr:MAG: hypothetical protein DRJ09_05630 [Bacteroidota bacterium]